MTGIWRPPADTCFLFLVHSDSGFTSTTSGASAAIARLPHAAVGAVVHVGAAPTGTTTDATAIASEEASRVVRMRHDFVRTSGPPAGSPLRPGIGHPNPGVSLRRRRPGGPYRRTR